MTKKNPQKAAMFPFAYQYQHTPGKKSLHIKLISSDVVRS